MDFKKLLNGAMKRPLEGDKVERFGLKERVSGYILTKAQQNSPAAGYNYEADVTELWRVYEEVKNSSDYPLSFNTVMMKVLTEGLLAAPRLNSHIQFSTTSSCGTLVQKKHIDIAMPILLESGKTFPIKLMEAEGKSLRELTEQLAEILSRTSEEKINKVLGDVVTARTIGLLLSGDVIPTIAQTLTGLVGKHKVATLSDMLNPAPRDGQHILQEELDEGSVCMTNWGLLYDGLSGNVTYTPLLFPQVFLFAMGMVRDREYAFKNEEGVVDIGVKKVLPITLMFDHRIGGFNDVMPFIKRLDEIFTNPDIIREW